MALSWARGIIASPRMSYRYSFESGPFDLVVRISGAVTIDELLDGRRRIIADPRTRPGLAVLFDYSAANPERLTADAVRRLAAEAQDRRFRMRAVAVAAPANVFFGFARMFMAFADIDGHAGHHVVVRSASDAIAWLQSLDGGR